MKIVVVGGTGLIGTKLVAKLRELGHDPIAAAPNTGVNTITGEGLAEALRGASVVVDVSNSPSFDGPAALTFFETATRNILAAAGQAGVRHHVALSVVGAELLPESGYMRAKLAQERLIAKSSIPFTIVHATQFFEFVNAIAAAATEGNVVRLAPVLIQPMAADDVAAAIAGIAVGKPAHGIVQIAGPEQFRLDEFIEQGLEAHGDSRRVLADPNARYFGAMLSERTLVPDGDARLGAIRFETWLHQPIP